MAKEICPICGNEIGFMSKVKLYDGIICDGCANKSGYSKEFNYFGLSFTVDVVRKAVNRECIYSPASFRKYFCNGHYVYFNYATGLWMTWGEILTTKYHVHAIKNIVRYDYVENDKKYSVMKTAGTALVGGLVFGGAGAVVGAVIGNKQKQRVDRAYILITEELGGGYNSIQVDLVAKRDKAVTVGTFGHNLIMRAVQEIGCELDNILANEDISKFAIEEKIPVEIPVDYDEIASVASYDKKDVFFVDNKSMAQHVFDYSGFSPDEQNKNHFTGVFSGLCARVNNWHTSNMCLQELSDYANKNSHCAMKNIQQELLDQIEKRLLEQFMPDEVSLFYKDGGLFSKGKEGFLITNKAVYQIGKKTIHKVGLSEIDAIYIRWLWGSYSAFLKLDKTVFVDAMHCIPEEEDLILGLICLLVMECHEDGYKIKIKTEASMFEEPVNPMDAKNDDLEHPMMLESVDYEKGKVRFCNKCGNQIRPGKKFCSKCGAQIKGRE